MAETTLGPRFHDALAYAAGHFAGHMRGNTRVPAIAHSMAVCALVLDMAGDEDEAIAALLHDVVEDEGGAPALAHIQATWGSVVSGFVEECSDEVEPSGRPWMELKRESVAKVHTQSVPAARIGLADKTDNARTLLRAVDASGTEVLEQHTAGSRDAVLWYYEALVEAYRTRVADLDDGAGPLLGEFCQTVERLRERSAPAPHALGSSA